MSRTRGPRVWAVASGKGGAGKSVLSANLAIGLAQSGPRVVAVDLDLGGANLQAIFGTDPAAPSLADVLRGDVARVEDALVGTSVPGVRLLSGARGALDVANPSHGQKRKLLGGLRRLDASHVVLDLGPGSGFHTLDAFLAADHRILVVTPEPTAVENAQHLLKAAFFRSLRDVAREAGGSGALAQVLGAACRAGATPRELVESACRADPALGSALRRRMRGFEVLLVVNRVELAPAGDPGLELSATCRAELGLDVRPVGSLASDDSVPAAVARGVPVLQLFPSGRFAREVRRLAHRLGATQPAPAQAPAPAPAPAPADPAPALPGWEGESPGRYLRQCRERLGLELAAVHERTRIRHHHLEHIEAERYAALPPDFYLKNYVRLYGEALGVSDPGEIAEAFLERARLRRQTRPAPALPQAGGPAAPRSSGVPSAPAPGAETRGVAEVPSAAELMALVDLAPEPPCPGPRRRSSR